MNLQRPLTDTVAASKTFAPLHRGSSWSPCMKFYLAAAFGQEGLRRLSEALCRPPRSTCLRLNTLHHTLEEVRHELQQELQASSWQAQAEGRVVDQVPEVPQAMLLHGGGQQDVDYAPAQGEARMPWREVAVSRKAAEGILRGAHVFVPGVVAASWDMSVGDLVAVSTILEQPGTTGVPRGAVLGDAAAPLLAAADRSHLHLGKSVAAELEMGRKALFNKTRGVAVTLLQRAFELPPCNGLLPGKLMLQNLPSIVAAQALSPTRGSRVLDMCAAPGGKTTALAALMGDEGTIIALDRSHAKAQEIRQVASELRCSSITAFKMDATQAVLRPTAPPTTATSQPAGAHYNGASAVLSQPAWCFAGPPCQASPACEAVLIAAADVPPAGSSPAQTASGHARPHLQGMSCSRLSTSKQGFEPASFDHILLDAPCTGLGLRPRLMQHATLDYTARYQRKLIRVAVELLKPGGTMVYSTCSISPAENEANVAWLLKAYPEMELSRHSPVLGQHGLSGQLRHQNGDLEDWLTTSQAERVQRFDPTAALDTIGFFIAKFTKS
eukprot:jgi/Astpho2/9936/e_gw1.00152.20.1_t